MADTEKLLSLAEPLAPLSGGRIKRHGRIEVDLGARLPAFDCGAGYAYGAVDDGDKGRSLYALVCDPRVPYRHKPMAVLRSKNNKNYVSVDFADRID
jgi:hypothetical protein